ncbi:unnamed protein product [Ambrosiozyma monospora]|uniref:Unnamed protein product n=1 Tax=Ambrosiozyma monospora TaxID=43982 RepID=A0A9W7DFX1_AMBMO|nr:unnamed protein product [Ambrosiozyma monospora]
MIMFTSSSNTNPKSKSIPGTKSSSPKSIMKTAPNHVVNKSFSRTPANSICVQDLKEIYSVFLYCLQLTDASTSQRRHPSQSSFFSLKRSKKYHPYSFTPEDAIKTMTFLNFEHGLQATSTKITYEITRDLAVDLLQIFFTAKLLHCPEDKTRGSIGRGLNLLQPTPKGVSLLHKFCLKMGIVSQNLPPILKSNFNSMELISFDRSSRTDTIIHNDNWDKLMFAHMMGPSINVWEPTNGSDEIINLSAEFEHQAPFSFSFDFNDFSSDDENCHQKFLEYLKTKRNDNNGQDNNQLTSPASAKSSSSNNSSDSNLSQSPFHHRFFTNPESDSHIQYYVATRGVRFYKNKVIEKTLGRKLILNHCVSGKAIVQYLMDCTDIMDKEEAVRFASHFLRLNLIFLASDVDGSHANPTKLFPTKDALYCLTVDGLSLVRWPGTGTSGGDLPFTAMINVKTGSESPKPKDIILKDVLRDPGMKYLFKLHLKEEYCEENLEAYEDISLLEKRIKTLKSLLKMNSGQKFESLPSPIKNTKKLTVKAAMVKLCNECISRSYTIYASYICDGATNELNIDSKLKHDIQAVMAADNSSLEYGECSLDNLFALHKARLRSRSSIGSVLESSESSSYENGPSVKKPKSALTLDTSLVANSQPVPSPTFVLIGPVLTKLDKIEVLYGEVKKRVMQMMETDSLAKFTSKADFNYSV